MSLGVGLKGGHYLVEQYKVCPKCGGRFGEAPALSRINNKDLICPDCGIREALMAAGMREEEKEEIIKEIHRKMVL